MNIIMSSPNQKNNVPSFIGLTQKLNQKDKQTKAKVSEINSGYNQTLYFLQYLMDYYKTLEKVENDLADVAKVFCNMSYVRPRFKPTFNWVLESMDAPYITVTPIP